MVHLSSGLIYAPSVENTQNQENVKLKLNKMRKIIADYVELTDEWVGTPDVVMYTSETADGYEIYILGWTDKNGHVKNMDNEENVFMYKENLVEILVDDFIAGEEFIEIYVSEDLIEDLDLINELEERLTI